MRRIFTSLLLSAVTVFSTTATDFTDRLVVTLSGTTLPAEEYTITVEADEDGTYSLTLKNFILTSGSDYMYVGTINIEDVEATTDGDVISFNVSRNITIASGDDTSILWLGPYLGEVPVDVRAEMRDDSFYAIIDIEFSGMVINVVFGNGGYQIDNSDFESFHTASLTYGDATYTSDEPDHWHSFMSASGPEMLVYFAGYTPHTFISDDTRPGSTGTSSVLVKALSVLGIAIGNGTITTGRLNTGSATATDLDSNYSWLDMSQTDLDDNGDPFYAIMNGRPDSVAVWLKFKQATHNDSYPYATFTATITDGTEYHEPEASGTYTNVVARAADSTIEETGDEWTRISLPFDYDSYISNGVEQKAILVTISTNAGAGKGSDGDSLFVDDLELIYNSKLSSLSVSGTAVEGFSPDITSYDISAASTISATDIEAVADGCDATVTTEVEENDSGVTATITVVSGDLKDVNIYTLNIAGATTGIGTVKTTRCSGSARTYDLGGREVGSPQSGVYIVHKADGTRVKMIKK